MNHPRGLCQEQLCRRPVSSGVMCDQCKAEIRRLNKLHLAYDRQLCEAEREDARRAKAFRVDFYAAVVRLGGSIFGRGKGGAE